VASHYKTSVPESADFQVSCRTSSVRSPARDFAARESRLRRAGSRGRCPAPSEIGEALQQSEGARWKAGPIRCWVGAPSGHQETAIRGPATSAGMVGGAFLLGAGWGPGPPRRWGSAVGNSGFQGRQDRGGMVVAESLTGTCAPPENRVGLAAGGHSKKDGTSAGVPAGRAPFLGGFAAGRVGAVKREKKPEIIGQGRSTWPTSTRTTKPRQKGSPKGLDFKPAKGSEHGHRSRWTHGPKPGKTMYRKGGAQKHPAKESARSRTGG